MNGSNHDSARAKRGIPRGVVWLFGWLVVTGPLLSRPALAQVPPERSRSVAQTQEDVARILRLLRLHVDKSTKDLQDLGPRIRDLQSKTEELLDELDKLQPPDEEQATVEAEKPDQVRFRPPIERSVNKHQIAFVCFERRVGFVDVKVLLEQVAQLVKQQRDPNRESEQRAKFEIPGCKLQFELTMKGRRGTRDFDWKVWVVRSSGETWEEIQRPDSAYRTKLSAHDPETHYCTFVVWPDSYILLHQIRELAWVAGFDVGLEIMDSGKPLPFGAGAGTVL